MKTHDSLPHTLTHTNKPTNNTVQCPLSSDSYGLGASLLANLTALVLQLNSGSLTLLVGWLGQLAPEVFAARIVR